MISDEQFSNSPMPVQFPERAQRRETSWIAVLRKPDGVEIPCNVKDVSKTGARIGVPASYDLPATFMLKVVGMDFVCRVKLAWRKGNFAGVLIEQVGKVVPKTLQSAEAKPTPAEISYTTIRTRRSKVSSF